MITATAIRQNDYALLENNLSSQNYAYVFSGSQSEVQAFDYDSLLTLFEAIETAKQAGLYCVGYFAYEAGLIIKGLISSTQRPCAHFVFYRHFHHMTGDDIQSLHQMIKNNQEDASLEEVIYNVTFDTSYHQFRSGFDQIQRYLNQGQTYQVNYTGQYQFCFQGNYFELYRSLRKQQLVSYGAYLPFSSGHILSFSPELFFTKRGSVIKVKPMKGTVSRMSDQQLDAKQVAFLKNDPKNLSENLIIVDLLRNDLAAIAKTGSVQVASLFDIERYQSVYQMTSAITAEIDEKMPLKALIKALFPCGSITGAPKLSTMNIINEVEQQNRGLYTGAIGYIMPNNDISFSVAIRTLQFDQFRSGYLGVGGGITTRSNLDEEWAEWHLKGHFFNHLPKDFQLVETLLYDQGYQFLEAHVKRMAYSSNVLNFVFDENKLNQQLSNLIKNFEQSKTYKVRVLLDQLGMIGLDYDIITQTCNHQVVICSLSKERVKRENVLFQHKTTAKSTRGFYNTQLAYYQADNNDVDDVVFVNEQGCVTETTRYNIIFQMKGQLFTPPVCDGLLNGIYRQYLLDTSSVQERSLSLDELGDIEQLYVCNSVRGMCQARFADCSEGAI